MLPESFISIAEIGIAGGLGHLDRPTKTANTPILLIASDFPAHLLRSSLLVSVRSAVRRVPTNYYITAIPAAAIIVNCFSNFFLRVAALSAHLNRVNPFLSVMVIFIMICQFRTRDSAITRCFCFGYRML